MPRVNEKKGEKNQWSDEQLQAAMEAVSSGELKAHAAAKQYGIPSSTLYDNVKGQKGMVVHHCSDSCRREGNCESMSGTAGIRFSSDNRRCWSNSQRLFNQH